MLSLNVILFIERCLVLAGENNLLHGGVVRTALKLAAPMLFSSLLQNLQSIIDLYWVGFLGKEALAAAAICGTIFLMVFPLILGTCSGAVALVSRAIGAGSDDEAGRIAGEAWRLALIMGVAMGFAGVFSVNWLCVAAGAEGVVLQLCSQYLSILFAGSFTAFALFVGNSIMQGAGNTTVPMVAMVVANIINIFLDPVLIFGHYGIPPMGIRGAAVATVISQFVSAVMIYYLLKRGRYGIRMRLMKPEIGLVKRLFRVGVPGSGQMLSRSVMALVLMRIVAGFGTTAAAAYGIGLRLLIILLMPAFAIANAVAVMVGQNLGAGKPGRASRAAWSLALIDACFMALAALFFRYGGEWVAARFSDAPEVQSLCVDFLRIVSPFYVFSALAIVLGRAFMGAGDAVPPMICTIVSLWGLQVPLAVILPGYFVQPSHGVFWAISIAVTAHGIMVALLFMLGRWKNRMV